MGDFGKEMDCESQGVMYFLHLRLDTIITKSPVSVPTSISRRCSKQKYNSRIESIVEAQITFQPPQKSRPHHLPHHYSKPKDVPTHLHSHMFIRSHALKRQLILSTFAGRGFPTDKIARPNVDVQRREHGMMRGAL